MAKTICLFVLFPKKHIPSINKGNYTGWRSKIPLPSFSDSADVSPPASCGLVSRTSAPSSGLSEFFEREKGSGQGERGKRNTLKPVPAGLPDRPRCFDADETHRVCEADSFTRQRGRRCQRLFYLEKPQVPLLTDGKIDD